MRKFPRAKKAVTANITCLRRVETLTKNDSRSEAFSMPAPNRYRRDMTFLVNKVIVIDCLL